MLCKFEGGPLDGQFTEMQTYFGSPPQECIIKGIDVGWNVDTLCYWFENDRHTYIFRGQRQFNIDPPSNI